MNEKRRHLNPYERAMESFARTGAGTWYLKQIAPRIDPPLLRFTGGRVSSAYPTPVMLLTTSGAKSGQPRTLPLVYVTDGEQLILMGSNYGKTSHPAWYRNLTANPRVDVLAGDDSGAYLASQITEPVEYDRVWGLALDLYAGYGDYKERAGDRTIPLVRLERVTA